MTVLAIAPLPGCDLPDRPTFQPVASNRATQTEDSVITDEVEQLEPPMALEQSSWETWDAYFVNNQHVGYSHVKSSTGPAATVGDVHFDLDHRVYNSNGDARVLQRLVLSCDESKGGRLVGFEAAMQVGLDVTQYSGRIQESNLIIEIRDGRQTERREIPWELNYRGMFAVEQSLRAKPMLESGESRNLKMLISGRYELATARLRCSGPAVVPLLDGADRELIEINVQIDAGDAEPIHSAIWTDDQGNIVRTYSPALNMIAYRTDQSTATAIPNDDLLPVSIAITGDMDQPKETKRVAYSIKRKAGADGTRPLALLPGPGQFVRGTPEGDLQVLVSRQEETTSGGFVSDQPIPAQRTDAPIFSSTVSPKSSQNSPLPRSATGNSRAVKSPWS